MLKALIRKQLLEILGFFYRGAKEGKRRNKFGIAAYVVLMLIAAASIGMMFYLVALSLYEPLAEMDFGWLYYALMGTMATVVGVIASVFTTGAQLYEAKDNEALLAMPIAPGKILLVRMLVLYLQTFVFEAVVFVPTAIVHWMFEKPGLTEVLLYLVIMCVAPLAALALACALGFCVTALTSRLRSKSLLTVVLSIGFLVLYYLGYSKINTGLQQLLINSEEVSLTMQTALYPFAKLGQAAMGDAVACLIFIGIVFVLFGVVYAVLSASFLKLVTTKRGAAKAEYKEKAAKAGSIEKALFQKEWKRFVSSPVYMMNCGLGSVMLIIGAILLLVKGDMVRMLLEQMSVQLPAMKGTEGLLACVSVMCIQSIGTTTSPSISIEGKNFWLLQSLPVRSGQILAAKLKLDLVLMLPPTIVCALVSVWVFDITGLAVILLPVACVTFACLSGAIGLFFNLKFPSLDWTSETVAVKQSLSVLFAMLSSWGVLFVLVGAYFLLRTAVSAEQFLAIGTLVLVLLLVVVMRWLKTKGCRILERL